MRSGDQRGRRGGLGRATLGLALVAVLATAGASGASISAFADRLTGIVPDGAVDAVLDSIADGDVGTTTDELASLAGGTVAGAVGVVRDLAAGGPPTRDPARDPPPPLCQTAPFDDIDLDVHEDAGGHTLARHVGLTDNQLLARRGQTTSAAASTFVDRATAEHLISATLSCLEDELVAWWDGPDRRLQCDARFAFPVGRGLFRNALLPDAVHGIRLVLDPVPISDQSTGASVGFRITTAFPKEGEWLTSCDS